MIRTCTVLECLSEKQPTVNVEKCTFCMNKVVFIGLLLSKHGVGPTASQPQTPSEVHSFLGLMGFSARFIPDFATTADPLRRLARKGEPFMWGEKQEKSFQKLKGQVASAPVLAYFDIPKFDLVTDLTTLCSFAPPLLRIPPTTASWIKTCTSL